LFKPVKAAEAFLYEELTADASKPYSPADLLEVMTLLTRADCGYISYLDTQERMGKAKIDAMIDRNILYLQPLNDTMTSGLPATAPAQLLKAVGAPTRVAMRMILDRRSSGLPG
jgi:hypothetical protein